MTVARRANWIALLWTAGVSLCLLFLPAYDSETDVVYYKGGAGGPPVPTLGHHRGTLADENGPHVYALLLLPVLLALVPLLVQRREQWRRTASWVAFGVTMLFVIVGIFSIGLPYVPALIPLAVAGVLQPEPGSPATTQGA